MTHEIRDVRNVAAHDGLAVIRGAVHGGLGHVMAASFSCNCRGDQVDIVVGVPACEGRARKLGARAATHEILASRNVAVHDGPAAVDLGVGWPS